MNERSPITQLLKLIAAGDEATEQSLLTRLRGWFKRHHGHNQPSSTDLLKDAIQKFLAGEPSLFDDPRLLAVCADAVRGVLVNFARSNKGLANSQDTIRLDCALRSSNNSTPAVRRSLSSDCLENWMTMRSRPS